MAELLVARGLVAAPALEALRARAAARAPGPSGSALLDLAVELNLVARPAAIAVLEQIRAAAAPDVTAWSQARPGPAGPPPGQTQAGQTFAGQSQAGQSQAGQSQVGRIQAGQTQAGPRPAGPRPPGPPQTGRGSSEDARGPADSSSTRWSETRAGPAELPDDTTRWEAGADDRTLQTPTHAEGGLGPAALAAAAAAAAAAMPRPSPQGEPPEARYDVIDGPAGELRVLDRRLQRHVLLVVAGEEPDDGRRLGRHARILAQLDHPAIPRVHDALRWEGRPAFTTDFVEGQTFGAAKEVEEPALLRAFLDVAAAVAHAHERGIVHGALGPARVVLGTYGRAWVTGWELARALAGAPPQAVRAAADVDVVRLPRDAARAPELLEGGAPGPAADVWGLGRVLERVVSRAGRGAPPELKAIARKACARDPGARYDAAADLAEDVRRYLDGRRVGAVRETPLMALRRLAKHHPLAAGVAGAAVAVVLGAGAVTLLVNRNQFAAASAQAEIARDQRERAAALEVEARKGRDAALANKTAAERRVALERALRAPTAGDDDPDVARGKQLHRAAEALRELERDVGADEATFAAARVLRARAEHHLRGAARPDPARALVDLRALCDKLERRLRRAPTDAGGGPLDEVALARLQLADALLARFLAARRLPGRAARAEEAEALAAMDALAATEALARLERAVSKVEADAAKLAAARPPAAVHEDPRLLEAVDALVKARPDLAYAHELRGRLRVALSVPGHHRTTTVRFPDGTQGEAERRGQYYGAFGAFFRASYLDPTEPEPGVSYLELWNAKYALHYPWRWIGGWALGNALSAARLTPRPEPALRVARLLERMERPAAALALLGPWAGGPDLEPAQRAEVELARARARLACGLRVDPGEVRALEPPAELAADRRLLLGWALLVAGQPRPGWEELMGALQTPPGPSNGLHDLDDALADPRIDPRALLPLLDASIPPPGGPADQSPVVHALLLGRVQARARMGLADVTGDVERLRATAPQTRMVTTRAQARLTLAVATEAARRQPQHPGSHLEALFVWARVNQDVGSTEREAEHARALILARLRALNAQEAARQFEGFDAVDEVHVRRAWVPPEVHPWRAGADER